MTRPQRTPTAQPVASLSSELIEARLAPPLLAQGLLARAKLSALLQAGLSKRLISVTAPAGYGKTTCLAQFVAQLPPKDITAAWLSLDDGDNDPLRFMRGLSAALHHADARLGRHALAQIHGGGVASCDALVASLLQDLQSHDRRVLLVLDDLHLLHHGAAHRHLERLIAHLPPNACAVLASRSRLPLPLSRLRLRDELLELECAHFGLELEEAADFMGRMSEAPLERAQVQTLHERTEGWIAGLQLASLALRDCGDCNAFLADFSGTDRDITEYLGEQVLASLPSDLREFLLGTSVFERFCAPLCDAALQRGDSHAMLQEIRRRNLFLASLDRSQTWLRYHHLFADYLRGIARGMQGGAACAIHQRASEWFSTHSLPHDAIRHAFEARDLERAADLVAAFSGELVQHRGEHATLLGWLGRLPQTLVRTRPQIRIGLAWSLVLTRRHAQAEHELRTLEAACAGSADRALCCVVEMIRCVYWAYSDQPLRARECSERWLAAWPQADAFVSGVVASVLASSCCACDAFEQGLQALALARRAFGECQADYGLAWCSALATMIAMRRGNYHEAMAQARRGIALVERRLGMASYAGSMLALLAAEICYEQNDLEQARQLLGPGLAFIDEHGLVEMTAAGYLTRARLLLHGSGAQQADACLLHGEALAHRLRLPRLATILAAERCTQRLQSGLQDEALQLARAYGFAGGEADAPASAQTPVHDSVCLLMLRLRLSGACASAGVQDAIDAAIWRARHHGHQAQLVRLLVLQALQQWRERQRTQSLRTLQEALPLAQRLGLVRSLLDCGPQVLDMAEAIVPPQEGSYLHQLLQAAGRRPRLAPRAGPKHMRAETLTASEIKVLRLLKAGLGNRELAQRLFLSEATVKWHLHNIFAKLGVRNRTSALMRAQESALL